MIEVLYSERAALNVRQRWASILTILVALGGLLLGYLLRVSMIEATLRFENKQFGIAASYPDGWLLEENQGNIVFRVQDPAALPFKTSLQVALIPIGADARPTDILNRLNIERANRFPAYRSLERVPTTLPNGAQGVQMSYAYAAVETNPFLQSEPIAVRAVDVVVLRGAQAIVISFESDAQSFERNRRYFDAFLRSLQFQ